MESKKGTSKNYMTEVDFWFEMELARYRDEGDAEAFKQAVKAKLLRSYRNGQKSGIARVLKADEKTRRAWEREVASDAQEPKVKNAK